MYTFDWLAKQADLRPDKTALVDTATGREFTYAQFNERASRFAEFMRREWKIHPSERVSILTPNGTDYFEVLYACAKIGAILIPLNWRLAVPELQNILADCTPRALIYDVSTKDAAETLGKGLQTLALVPGKCNSGTYEDALASVSGRSIAMPARSLDETWYLLYTAGTTGRPKGVIQTFGMVLFNYLNIGPPINLTAENTTLNNLPVFHTGGNNLYANPTFIVGGTAIIQRAFDAGQTLQLLSDRVTAFFGVPAMYLFASQHPDFEKTDLSGMRSWACGGAPMPLSLLELYAKRGINIRQGFGMTETGPTVFLVDEAHAISKSGSVGRPQAFVEVRIVDKSGVDVPTGEIGELLIKGPGVTPGYWQLPEITQQAFEDGWLHSGDVARRDEEGYYYIVDRWKDMFISGGENVYPAEVENVLFSVTAIAEAAVIGVPDPKWGEVGRALIVVKPGQTLTEQEVLEFCQGRLAKYKIPKSIVFIEALPRNAAGKVLKTELRVQFGAGYPMNSPSTVPTLGQVITHKRTFTQQDFNIFAELSHDDNPIHVDAEFAATTRFGRTVAHGMLLYGVLCGVLSAIFPNARQLEQELVFPKPTYAEEEMTIRLEVVEIWPGSKQARLSTTITRPDGENSCEGQMLVQWTGEVC